MSLVSYGLGPSGEGAALSFLMRAYRITAPTGFIYWEVADTPDTSGTFAPVPAAELTDILVVWKTGTGP